jgi:hypothetical protein
MIVNWYGGLHWTYVERAWLGYFAMREDGRVILRYEQTWYKKTPKTAAADIQRFMREKGIPKLLDCVAQPDLFPKNPHARGETVSETFRTHGIVLTPGDDDRVNGWARIRSWMEIRTFSDEDKEVPVKFDAPSITFHPDCPYFLDTFLTLISDKKIADDIEDTPDMYPANGLRYFVMARPLPPTKIVRQLPPDAIGHEIDALRRGLRYGAR